MWQHDLDIGLHEHVRCAEPGPAIIGDDGVSFADDRGAGDVAVIEIIESVAVLPVLGGLDLRPRKRLLQLIEKAPSTTGAIGDPALVVQAGKYVVQLEENPRSQTGA